MSDSLDALKLFISVAQTRSFSQAARLHGTTQSSASRTIAGLEQDIGVSLFTRTTRSVTLTEAGSAYLARVKPAVETLQEAMAVARGTDELRGVLRVAAPPALAVRGIIARLPEFLRRHPRLRLDLSMTDEREDLVRQGIDVAFRIGKLTSSVATSRRIGSSERVLVASPVYLRRTSPLTSPAGLATHTLIVGPGAASPKTWSFERAGKRRSVKVQGRVSTNSNEGAVAAAVAGLGILACGKWCCSAEVEAGSLVRVLSGWSAGSSDVHAVFPAGKATTRAARAFVEHLLTTLV